MPQVVLYGITGTRLQEHAILLTQELTNLQYSAHLVEDKTDESAILPYLESGDVIVRYKECDTEDVLNMVSGITPSLPHDNHIPHEEDDVIVWVDTPIDKLDKLKKTTFVKEDYMNFYEIMESFVTSHKWKQVAYDTQMKLQSSIQVAVLVNLVYTKDGKLEFGKPPTLPTRPKTEKDKKSIEIPSKPSNKAKKKSRLKNKKQ